MQSLLWLSLEGAMIYTTAFMNFHKELYRTKGGKKLIRVSSLLLLIMYIHAYTCIYIYIYAYGGVFIQPKHVLTGMSCLHPTQDWAHKEALRLRACFSHLHRLTYKTEVSRSGYIETVAHCL